MYDLIQKRDYFCPSRYVSGRISEYDIRACNINMLKYYGMISDELYNYLSVIPKIDREIYIGNMMREDKKIYDTISKGIKEFKVKLASTNNIQDKEIVRIANDAVYVNRPIDLFTTVFDNIEFKQKGIYSSVVKLNKSTIIFLSKDMYGNSIVDVKGIGDNDVLHQNYMISIIVTVINTMEMSSAKDALALLNDIYKDYVSLKLDKGCYREFNSISMYKYKHSNYGAFYIEDINDIDISYNLYILRELWSIIIERSKIS